MKDGSTHRSCKQKPKGTWIVVEIIGNVWTYRCDKCSEMKTRVK